MFATDIGKNRWKSLWEALGCADKGLVLPENGKRCGARFAKPDLSLRTGTVS